MAELISEHLNEFLVFAYTHAPAVRELFDSVKLTPDDIKSLPDLDRLPITSKDRLTQLQQAKPPFGGFLAAPLEELEHLFFSPGPLYEPGVKDDATLDSVREMVRLTGFRPGEAVINTFGYHLIPTGLALDQALCELGARVIPAGVGNPDLQLKMIVDFGVSGYVGTPSWLGSLLQKAAEMGLSQLPIRKALVSAEPLPPSLRQSFVEKGITVVNGYGTAELGLLAYNLEGGMAMRLLETAIVQVVNPETGQSVSSGEAGEVVVTTFNRAYPLIRLGTGDLAVNMDPSPGKTRQGERSIILVGRVGEAVKVRGMFVHPNQLRFAVMQAGAGVAKYQAVVGREGHRDRFTLRIAASGEGIDRPALQEALTNAVRSTCRVSLDSVEFVAAGEIPENAPPILDQRTWD